MGEYLRPCGAAYISDTWQGHRSRTPPSSEPGTDYAVPVGTPVVAADDGYVFDRKTSTSYATGRYVHVRLDDGRDTRDLHLSSIVVNVGDRVTRGQIIAYSGASANGSEWGVGAHVHKTLWPGAAWAAPTIDFEEYVGDDLSPVNPPDDKEREVDVFAGFYYTRDSDARTVWYVTNGLGYWLEWSDASMTVDAIAKSYQCPPFARVTQGMRNTAYSAAASQREAMASAASATSRRSWAILLGLLAVAVVVDLAVVVWAVAS